MNHKARQTCVTFFNWHSKYDISVNKKIMFNI